jgi:hypothetical protein
MSGPVAMFASRVDELRALTSRIIDRDRTLEEVVPEAHALRDLFEGLTAFRPDWQNDSPATGTRLDCGLAVSPTHAALCLREWRRTSAFLRGLAQAIEEARQPARPVRVLYAGCGPYALLALPLMTVFSRGEAVFTLLECHREVLDRALALIDGFGLSDRVTRAHCVDATRFQVPPEEVPDVIVSEVMAVALHNEPQVGVTRHLLRQAPQARMVPAAVKVALCALDPAREHRLLEAGETGPISPPARDRIELGGLFELDRAQVAAWGAHQGDHLPACRARLPESLAARYRLHLLTHITVYGETSLGDYDCSLTMPRRLRGAEALRGGETLQFRYRLGPHPELEYEVVGEGPGVRATSP